MKARPAGRGHTPALLNSCVEALADPRAYRQLFPCVLDSFVIQKEFPLMESNQVSCAARTSKQYM